MVLFNMIFQKGAQNALKRKAHPPKHAVHIDKEAHKVKVESPKDHNAQIDVTKSESESIN